ncbi:MAG: hypothetical protein JWN67_1718 [Actinomycetia bacterium]|nr:hypothetical protein [Actinomycetes bacterium]
MRRLTIAVVAAALVLLGPVPAGAQAGPGLSIRLVDAPADRRDDPRARIYIVDHLKQGDRIERHIELGNGTDQPLTVSVYAAAAKVADGQFRFGDGHAANDLTRWTRVEPARVVVAPHGTAVAAVTITVPADATDGERYGVVWAELPPSGGTAAVVNRVGVRMYLSVGEGKEPTTDFRIDALTAARDGQGRPLVRTTVTNTGGRAIDLSGELQLRHGPGSLSAGPFDVELGTTLAPGDAAPAVIHLAKDLPAGPWDATVTVRAGELVKQARATITFPTGAGSASKPVVAESVQHQRRVLIPIAVALAAAVLAALGTYALRLRRRRRSLVAV